MMPDPPVVQFPRPARRAAEPVPAAKSWLRTWAEGLGALAVLALMLGLALGLVGLALGLAISSAQLIVDWVHALAR